MFPAYKELKPNSIAERTIEKGWYKQHKNEISSCAFHASLIVSPEINGVHTKHSTTSKICELLGCMKCSLLASVPISDHKCYISAHDSRCNAFFQ